MWAGVGRCGAKRRRIRKRIIMGYNKFFFTYFCGGLDVYVCVYIYMYVFMLLKVCLFRNV